MNCYHCGQPMREYVGFMSYPGKDDNPWDCINEDCDSETAKAPTCGGSLEVFQYGNIYDTYSCYDCGKVYTQQQAEDEGFECAFTPTRSEQDRDCEESQAKSASSQQQHTQVYPGLTRLVRAGGLPQYDQDLFDDDSDQCTLRQQGSGPPPLSSTPKQQYDRNQGILNWLPE